MLKSQAQFDEILEIISSGKYELSIGDLGSGPIRAWQGEYPFCPITLLCQAKLNKHFSVAAVNDAAEMLNIDISSMHWIVNASDFESDHYSQTQHINNEIMELRRQLVEAVEKGKQKRLM